ncbi:MAG: hypothetical protein WBK76_04025 [Candidatus Saccharimonadales bacterium]
MAIFLLIILLLLWAGLYGRSMNVVEQVPKTFASRSKAAQNKAVKSYKRNILFIKFTKSAVPKIAWIAGSMVLGIVSGSGPVPFVLLVIFWLIYGDKLKKPVDSKLRKLDEWVIIANQTILNK